MLKEIKIRLKQYFCSHLSTETQMSFEMTCIKEVTHCSDCGKRITPVYERRGRIGFGFHSEHVVEEWLKWRKQQADKTEKEIKYE